MYKSRNNILRLSLAILLASISGTAFGQALQCETVDFNGFSHADPITELSLFGGDVNLTLTAYRNSPAATVNVTAYDTELYTRPDNPPPNSSHDDTQRFILCNNAANGGNGECDGVVAMIPDVDFIENADDTQGGTITITGFTGNFAIPSYSAVDSDGAGRNIFLSVGPGLTLIGGSSGLGNGSVETVTTTGQQFSTQAQFLFEGSGGIDNIEICRVVPPTASLGDRVWEDLDRDGVQDCSDDNTNGIIGDAGDSGPECDAGIPNISVDLLDGNCETPLGQQAMTDADGFYLFENLPPGDYCVNFGLPPEDFCDTDGFDLGAPVFTAKNAGSDDAQDSDADPMSGTSDPTNLTAGETDRTIDAGVYCPAKIGDFVFFDDNENGTQDSGEGGVSGVKTTLFECGPDMIAGTGDDVMTDEMRFTDEFGMYMYGAEDDFDLPPGKYFVVFDPTTFPLGFDFTTPGVGPDGLDSDCLPPNGLTACTDLTASRSINLDRDCGLIPPPPPECNLFLDKSCRVEAPPSTGLFQCDKPIDRLTMIWNGAVDVRVNAWKGSIGSTLLADMAFVGVGDELTVGGYAGSPNDVIWEIFDASTNAKIGDSTFHLSCSDADMNGPEDCGLPEGDGKDKSGFLNMWLLEGMVDAKNTLDCTADPSEDGFSDNCSFEPEPLPSCDNGPKPDNLTWRYDGGTGGDGDCADSTFFSIVNADGKMHEDFECSGTVNTALQVTAVDDDGNAFLLNPGDSFTTLRDDIKSITLADSNGGTQDLVFHTSCSQPLEAKATAGAITLAGLDDRDGAQDVTYRYELTNFGDPLTGVGIEDNPLGTIASGLSLGSDESASFEKMVQIFGTTVNTAQASGLLANGDVCAPTSAFDSVTVAAVIPPCSLSFELDKVEDDKLKIKITNNDTRDRTVTLQSLSVSFPAARGDVEKIKLDGDAYKRNDSSNPINGTPASFGPSDWTESDVSKRQIEAGKTETLEIETTEKSDKNGRFEVSLDFGDGCTLQIVVENQQVQ